MARTGQVGAALPVEVAFLAAHGVPPALLRRAAAEAAAQGVGADEALLASGQVEPSAFYRALAAELGLPFLAAGLRAGPAARYPESVRAGIVPRADGAGFAAAPRGETLARLLARRGAPGPGLAVTTPAALRRAVFRAKAPAIAAAAAHALPEADPGASFRDGATWGQAAALVAGSGLVSAAAAADPGRFLALGTLVAAPGFLAMVALRLATLLEPAPVRPPEPPPRIPDGSLPAYTVLVALYREGRVADKLVRSLAALDYPAAKLDVKLVVEAGDLETQEALARAGPPGTWEVLVAPPGQPRTKPRALNVALPLARGEFVVVYDAEDEPEPDQLRLAVAGFGRAARDVACLQARLAIDNAEDSWLARLFAVEYAGLFDVINPGLARMDCPLPLGGTSNHFRTEVLRGLGAWDAWNVTEDADLGIRLALRGYRVADLPSTTYEEAPAELGPWMRQRVRWMKGFMQVCITHSRRPLRAMRALGPFRFFGAVTMTLGTVISALAFPVLTGLSVAGLWTGSLLSAGSWWEAASAAVSLVLFGAGLVAMVGPGLLGARRRGWRDLAPSALLLPAYYVLVSAAAWRALYELASDPARWNKTEHGLARTSRRRLLSSPREAPSRPPPAGG